MPSTESISSLAQASSNPEPTRNISSTMTDTGLENFFRLMRSGLSGPLAEIAKLSSRLETLRAAGLMPLPPAADESFENLAQISSQCEQYSRRLTELGSLLLDSPIEDDERLLLDQLISDLASEHADIARSRNVGLRIEAGDSPLAPVYASRHWLTESLEWLMVSLIEAAPSGSQIQIGLRQVGMHILVRGGVSNHAPSPKSRDLLGAPKHPPISIADAATWAQLDLAFVQAIVSMYGGMFKADLTAAGKLHQFTFTLPTGIATLKARQPNCVSCPIQLQTLQYASDLADLMSRHVQTSPTNDLTDTQRGNAS
jgi:hypothetical protein